MHVVHYCKAFSRLSETFIYDQIVHQKENGVNVSVLTHERVQERERPFGNIEMVPWPSALSPRRIACRALELVNYRESGTSAWPQLRERLRRSLQESTPDIVHAHFGPQGVVLAPVAQSLGIPLVVSFYGYDISRFLQLPNWEGRYQKLGKQASRIIGISNHICNRLEEIKIPKEKIECIHLGVDISRFEYSDPFEEFDGGVVRCLHVGRLVEKKSPRRLIRAIQLAQHELGAFTELHLTIAGDGPLMSMTEEAVKSSGLEGRVSLLGAVPHQRVVALMQNTHLYTQHCVTASDGDQEGQGVTFVEASACGRPIVSTKHNGIPDVVLDGKTGVLVDEGDVHAMGKAIASLARDPEMWTELGRAGRAHAERNFSIQGQTAEQIDLYNKALHCGEKK